MAHQTQLLMVMIAYLSLLIIWGIIQGRKVKNGCDYAIAGRKLPGPIAALSERATGESSWALLGLPGFAYATGLSGIWTALGCVAGIITAWAAISHRLRDEAEVYEVNTFIEYIAKRHHASAASIRTVASITIVFFFFFYVGAQFLGGGKTLHSMFNLDPRLGMLLTALIIVPYTVYGGFRSVVYTDAVQAVVMITALVAGPVVGIIAASGNPDIFAQSIPAALSKAGPGYSSLTGTVSGFAAGVVIMGGLSWFFGYLGGQPQLCMRFMAIENRDQAMKGCRIGIIWTILAYIGALSIGWLGICFFGPESLQDPELVMPEVMLRIFPPAIASILITGAIAAMISTADSLLILSSTELSENLVKPYIHSRGNRKVQELSVCRWITAILAVIALALAYISPSKLIYTIVGYVWAGIGSTFSVVILLTLFWKRYHGRAAISTIVSGMLFTIIWISTGMDQKITARVMTFLVAGIVAIAATYLLDEKRNPAG
ncbi:MAG: sodium/solute symporter [Candidatus Latescibacteria bacterium]|nr:sodium/solute symporter [bacterium]MBD3424306.1 sodium/solute symporter [Candidatus Latescibacterota bacterium]